MVLYILETILIVYSGLQQDSITYAVSSSYQLDLNLYRSTIDTKFAVFSYRHPTLSSTKISDNTFDTFVFHNFNSSLWDLDNVFLGEFTKIVPFTNTDSPHLIFRTYLTGIYNFSWIPNN
jgi:hypothetical protein